MKLLFLLVTFSQACTDTFGWKDKNGNDCQYYQKKNICKDNRINRVASSVFIAGSEYNFPELNCCACGKTGTLFYQDQKKKPGTCEQTAFNNKSKYIVQYCAVAKQPSSCVMAKPWYRSIHCQWFPAIEAKTFNKNQDW